MLTRDIANNLVHKYVELSINDFAFRVIEMDFVTHSIFNKQFMRVLSQ